MNNKEKKIKEIKDRLNKISSLPWKSYIEGRDHESGESFIMGSREGEQVDIYLNGVTDNEQDFIACAPGDISYLLSIIDELSNFGSNE